LEHASIPQENAMQRSFAFTVTLALGLLGPGSHAAGADPAVRQFPETTPVVIVGRISSQPRNAGFAHEKKMQVSVGQDATDYTLHLKGARIIGPNGHEARVSDLQDKWWVRAEGSVMSDPRRIQAYTVRVFSKTLDNLKGTRYNRPGMAHGYVIAMPEARRRR
jgi:hypothetical protein